MADGPEPICFTCGLPSGSNARLNHLPNGQVCPSCRDRLLEALPAPFPVALAREDEEVESGELEAVDGTPEPASTAEPMARELLPLVPPPRDPEPA